MDVTDDASIADVARQVGALDILVNNAGISGDHKTPDREDAGAFRRIYETNVLCRLPLVQDRVERAHGVLRPHPG